MRGVAIRPTRKILFLLGGIMIVVLGVSIFLGAKQYGQMTQVDKDITGRQAELEKRKGVARQLTSAMTTLESARRDVAHLEEGVTEKDYVPTLLGQIEALGKECDLRVVGVEPQEKPAAVTPPPPAEGEGGAKPTSPGAGGKEKVDVNKPPAAKPATESPYDSQQVQITVTGTYWNVVDFLTKLTQFPKIVAVTTVEVEQNKEGSEGISPILNVAVTFDAFLLDKKKKSDDKSTPGQPATGAVAVAKTG